MLDVKRWFHQMPFLGARSWLRPLIALHALVEGLAGFHSLPGLQGGTVLLWFPVLPEHQEVAASNAPHGTESTEESDSSDDDDPPLRTDTESLSRRSSRLLDSGLTPGPPRDSSGARSGLALDVEEQLQLIRSQRRRLIAAMRNLRFRWSSAEGYIKCRMQRDASRRARGGQPAMLPSRQKLARFKLLYKSGRAQRERELRKLERELQDLERQNEQLLKMHAVRRRGRGNRPAKDMRANQLRPPASTDESQCFAEPGPSDPQSAPTDTETTDVAQADQAVPGCSWWGTDSGAAPLRPNPKAAVPVRADEDKRGTPFSELTLIRAQKANLLAMRRTIRSKWKSQAAYVNMRMHEINFHRKGKGLPPLELTPELLRDFSSQYNDRLVPRVMRELELSGQIGALEEKERDIFKCCLRLACRTSVTAETETPGPRVPTGGAPNPAPELSTQPELQFHRQVPSTDSTLQIASTPHLLSAAPGAPPSREQVPILSWGPVSTTDGARLESHLALPILGPAGAQMESQSALPAMGSAGRSHTTTAARSAHIIGPPCVAPPSCLWQHQETPVQLGSTESPSAAPDPFPQYSPTDTSAASYAIPCRTGDRGETQYPSPSQLEQHAAACSPGRFEPGSELPAELLEFILDHSTAASAVSAHTSAVLEKPVPLPAEPWSPGIAFPNIVSPSEQPSTSHWWPDPPSSSSDRRLWPSAPFEGRLSSPWPWGS
ncbi:hypothetical protein TGVEG_245980 [Toxoplasma gondii VEG]|uniref:Uncharacterized protein n=1 Tax=Toxoplasma gondii (strain ATCC 50861 / VEG) TaxID=432359 RepID=V5BFK6_TOXGV|nr:hypothetical protein TGVEG_245980 [Toxoplasma gondii VEG]CEL78296.1 TPA: hypothetical protein BN1205_005820 [Toxoplasma gondii VEG]